MARKRAARHAATGTSRGSAAGTARPARGPALGPRGQPSGQPGGQPSGQPSGQPRRKSGRAIPRIGLARGLSHPSSPAGPRAGPRAGRRPPPLCGMRAQPEFGLTEVFFAHFFAGGVKDALFPPSSGPNPPAPPRQLTRPVKSTTDGAPVPRSQSCLRSLARRAATRGAAARQAQWMCQHVRKAHRTPSSGGLSSTVHLRRRYGVRTAARPLALAWRSRSSVSSWTTPHRHGVSPSVCPRECAHTARRR